MLGHFFFLSSGTVWLSYMLLGKKAEFCPKPGYFQLDCVQLCDQMTCSAVSWVIKRWAKEGGRGGWAALKVAAAQLRVVIIFKKLHGWKEKTETSVAEVIQGVLMGVFHPSLLHSCLSSPVSQK